MISKKNGCDSEKIKINSPNSKIEKNNNLKIKIKSCFSSILWSIFLIIIILISIFYLLILLKKNSTNKYHSQNIKNNTKFISINQSIYEQINTDISIKNQSKLQIKYNINETLVYKKIKKVHSVMEIENENKTQDIITTSYILFNIYDTYLKNEKNRIFYANLLVLNSSINDGNTTIPSGGINILQDFEKNNSIEENNDNINIESEYGKINEIELNNFDELKNINFNKYITQNIDNINNGFENITNNVYSKFSVPILNFSFYENGKILETYFADGLDDVMIQLLNGTLYDIIPDLTQTSKLRILNEDDNNETKFEKETIEQTHMNGFTLKNSEIETISNSTIDNDNEKLSQISSIGKAKFESDDNDQVDDDNDENNPFRNEKVGIIPNGIKKMYFNETSVINLVWTSKNESIVEIIKEINKNITYVKDYSNEKNNTLRLLNMFNISEVKYNKFLRELKEKTGTNELDSFKKDIEFSFKIFKINLFGVKFSLGVLIEGSSSNGDIYVQAVLTILDENIPLYEYKFNSNVAIVINKYVKSFISIGKQLYEKYEYIRIQIKNNWLNIIKENLGQFSNHITSIFDISKLYYEPIKRLTKAFIDSAKYIFNGIKEILISKLDAFKSITHNIIKEGIEEINEMLKDIRNQYIKIIDNAKEFATNIQNIGFDFINDIKEGLKELEEFDLSLMYTIYDQLIRPIDFLSKFEKNIFDSIKKGINSAITLLIELQNKLIGDKIGMLESIMGGLLTSPILKEGVDESSRFNIKNIINSLIDELNEHINIIKNKVFDNYLQDINNKGKQLSINLEKNITFFSNKSNALIKEIKSKIENIELMELYSTHLDIIDSIRDNILLISNNKFYELFSSYQDYLLIYKLNEELLINATQELKLSADKIISILKDEVNEMRIKLENVKINLSENYRMTLGDIAFHLIEIVTPKDLEILVNNFYNLLDSMLLAFQKRDEKNYEYLFIYLNNVINEYKNSNRMNRKGVIVDQNFHKFLNKNNDYKELVNTIFEPIANKSYFYIYNSIINVFDSKIFKKIDYLDYKNDEHLYFLYGYLDYLNQIKDLIYKYISESIYSKKVKVDIDSKYLMNFSNSSMILYQKGNDLFNVYSKYKFYYKCDTDFCYQKKNPKRFRPHHDWWTSSGWNVDGREGYKKIITEINNNTFDDQPKLIFENFIKKYNITIENYSELIGKIDNTVKESQKKIYNEFLSTKKFNDTIEEYINKYKSLKNIVLGKNSIENIYNYLTKNIKNKISKYYSSISSYNDKLTQFYKNNFKDSFFNYLQKPNEILYKFEEIQNIFENIEDKFQSNIINTLQTQLNTEIRFLYNKFTDITNENIDYLLKNIPSFDNANITQFRKNIIHKIPISIESILIETYNNISSISGLSKILLKDENDFFEIGKEIKTNTENLLNSFSIPFNYIKNDIIKYIPTPIKEIVEKNSVLTKIYQSKYSLNILKQFSDEIAKNDVMKIFKISDYISLFKEFIINNFTEIINDANKYLDGMYTSKLSEIEIFFNEIESDVQGLYIQNIMNLDILNMTLENFIKNGFNVTKWQNESIEISLNNFEKKIHELFIKEKNNLLSEKQIQQFIFNETNMNITYFKLKNQLLDPIRNIIYNNYKYSIDLNIIHCLINQTQTIMRKNTKELNQLLKKILSKKEKKIILLNKEININEISMNSLWEKIFDYSNGIFFNYTKYFNGIKNLKIDLSGIKSYLIEREERLNTILDDEYYYLLNEIRDKAGEIIGQPKEEEKKEEPEHEKEEEKKEEEENSEIKFNVTEIDDDKEEFEEKIGEGMEEVLKRDEEEEKEAIAFCNECNKNISEKENNNNNTIIIDEKCEYCNKSDEELEMNDEKNDNIRIRRLSNDKRILIIKYLKQKKRKLEENIINDFSNNFLNDFNSFSSILSNEFVKIFSNNKINENILKNISQFNQEFFEVKVNLEEAISESNILDNIDFIQSLCNKKMEEVLSDFRKILDQKIIGYFQNSLNFFEERYGKPFINIQIQNIIENNLTQIFNFINEKLDNFMTYFINLTDSMTEIPQLTYFAFFEVFDYVYEYIMDNIDYFFENIIKESFQNLINDVANEITEYYTKIITTNTVLKENFNENVLDIFNSLFTKTKIEVLKKNAISIFQNKSLGLFIIKFENVIKTSMEKLNIKMKKTIQNKLNKIFSKMKIKLLEPKYNDIYNITMEFNNSLNNILNKILFKVEGIEKYYSSFINKYVMPPLNVIFDTYEKLTNYSLKIVNDTINKFEDLSPMVKKNLNTDEIHKILVEAENKIESIYDQITFKIRETIYSIAEFILNHAKDIFVKFNQMNLYQRILDALKKIKNGETNISESISYIISGKRIRRLIREKYRTKVRMRRTSFINFNMITKPIKLLINEINDFINTFKNLKQFIQLIGNFSRFKELIIYGITHIKDPLNYLLKQIESYLTKEQLKSFEERVLKDMDGIIDLYKYHREKISSIFEKVISITKFFPDLFSGKIIKEYFENTIETIITIICDKIIELLNPYNINIKREIPPKPIFQCIIPIFFLPFRFAIDMLFEYEYGINIHSRVPKIFFGGRAGASATIRARAGLFLGILEFGAQILGKLGSGFIELSAFYNLRETRVGLMFYYELKAFEFNYGGYMNYPWIEFIKIKIKCWFVTITVYFPVIVMKTKELEGKIFKGLKISNSYEKIL